MKHWVGYTLSMKETDDGYPSIILGHNVGTCEYRPDCLMSMDPVIPWTKVSHGLYFRNPVERPIS